MQKLQLNALAHAQVQNIVPGLSCTLQIYFYSISHLLDVVLHQVWWDGNN